MKKYLLILVILIPLYCKAQSIHPDIPALTDLYNSTNGNNWANKNKWLSDNNPCGWYGISCNSDNRVSTIWLYNNNLIGNLPNSISSLTKLKELVLFSNKLTGSIPQNLDNLIELKRLILGSNKFNGSIPSNLGSLQNLEELSLGANQLTGNIPESFKNLTNIKSLQLGANQLTGQIQSWIGNLESLTILELTQNPLGGTIPKSIGNLVNLEILNLEECMLTGSIPNEIGNLSRLNALLLSFNFLRDSIPSSLKNLKSMKSFGVHSNNLTGEIPEFLSELVNLEGISAGKNLFTGKIPSNIGNLSNLRFLQLQENRLTGNIPSSIGNLSNLVLLNLSNNFLCGCLHQNLLKLCSINYVYISNNSLPNWQTFCSTQNGGVCETIQHFHQLSYQPFNSRKLLTENDIFKVCADGSEASIIKLIGGCIDYNKIKAKIRENTSGDVALFGNVTVLYRSRDSLVIRYKHPEYFNGNNKSIILNLDFVEELNPSNHIKTNKIEVYRVPVVFVHGFNADSTTFKEMESHLLSQNLYEPLFINRTDYSSTKFASFLTNKDVVPNAINTLINTLRLNNISVGKVACVGHSMGGVLSRIYLQNSSTTAYCGNIQKMITISTPHSGSHLTCLLFDPSIPQTLFSTFATLFIYNTLFWCNSCDAILDLSVESTATRSLLNGVNKNRNLVPTHAIATRKAYNYYSNYYGGFVSRPVDYLLFNQITRSPVSLFGEEGDWAVSYSSQLGGLSSNCTTTIDGYMHTESTKSFGVMTKVYDLLKTSPQSSNFCQNGFSPQNFDCNLTLNKTKDIENQYSTLTTTSSLIIASQKKGMFVLNAQNFDIKVQGTSLSEISAYVSYNKDSVYVARLSGNNVNFSFPINYQFPDNRNITIIGKTLNGEYISLNAIENFSQSLKSGFWDDPTVWKNNVIPTQNDIVILNNSHNVTIRTSSKAKAILQGSNNLIFTNTGSLTIE